MFCSAPLADTVLARISGAEIFRAFKQAALIESSRHTYRLLFRAQGPALYRCLDEDVRLVQAGIELCPPGVKVCLNVLIIIAIAPPHQGLGAQGTQSLVHALAHGTKVLILLVAQPKDSIEDSLESGAGTPQATFHCFHLFRDCECCRVRHDGREADSSL